MQRRGSTGERLTALAAAMAVTLSAYGCGQLFGPKATLGPGAIVRGRSLYNQVISDTNSEQTLELIVRARYGEPSGLLSVSSVTANLRATAKTEAEFGIGASENFKGNLVPLAVGVAYEENPTISYTPVQGERYAKNILAPIGLDVLVLLLNTDGGPRPLLAMLIKQLNGLANPLHGPEAARGDFQTSLDLLGRLEAAGQATWVPAATPADTPALVIHRYGRENLGTARELLRLWDLPERLTRGGRDIVLPVKHAFDGGREPALRILTRSVWDLIELAASAVEVPAAHQAAALAEPEPSPLGDAFRIQSSPGRPEEDVLVAVRHHGWWFYVAANDATSKLAFRVIQTLINMRLVEAAPQAAPTLTLPVGK